MSPDRANSAAGAARAAPGGRRDPEDTKERLLDAAERLFARRGFDGTSLRAVTQAAGTSVSAAHYHFGSKEALLRATLLRRVEPLNRLRLERLTALAAEADGRPVALEAVLDAYLRPLFEARAVAGESPARFVAARLYADPPELVASLKRELFGEVSRRLLDALSASLPGRSRAELALALQFLVGIMVHVTSGHLQDAPHLDADALSDETVLARVVAFVAAGLRGTETVHPADAADPADPAAPPQVTP